VADRYDRRKIMIAADLARGLIAAGLVFLPSLPAIYVAAAAISALSTFFGPARGAIVPQTVPAESLLAANSLSALSNSLTRIIGSALGAALVGVLGARAAFAFNSASFFVSALFIALLSLPRAQASSDRPAPGEAKTGVSARVQLRESLTLLLHHPRLAGITLLVFFNTLGLGAANVLTAPLVTQTLGANTASLGWLMTAEGLGTAVGVTVLGAIVRATAAGWVVLASSIVLAAAMLGLSACAALWQAVALFLAAGVGLTAFNVSAETETQRVTTDAIRGRVFSLIMAVLSAGSLLSLLLGGLLADLAGVRTTFAVMGLLIATGCAIYAWPLIRAGRQASRSADAPGLDRPRTTGSCYTCHPPQPAEEYPVRLQNWTVQLVKVASAAPHRS
jgi:predicted MFS family arabinose efflux permease